MPRMRAFVVCVLVAGSLDLAAQTAEAPLRLRDVIAEALRMSPALSPAADGVDAARIQRRLAESRFGLKVIPTLNAGTAPADLGSRSFGVDVSKRTAFGTEITTSVNSLTYGSGPGALHDAGYTIGVSQPLFRGLTAPALELELANRRAIGSERAMVDARQQLIVTATSRYAAVIKARRIADAAERALDRATKFAEASRARANVGLATQLDVLRADLLASQAELTLASEREALTAAVEEVNLLLGRPVTERTALADEALSDDDLVDAGFHLPEGDDDQAVDRFVRTALSARVDVREAHDKIGDAERAVSVSRWNLLPQASANVSYTQRGLGPMATPGFANFLNGWRVGVTTSYPLDRSDQLAAAGSADLGLRAAQRAALDADRRAEADVRRAFRAWTRMRQTIELQRKALELADKQLRLAQLRFERGLATSLEVIDAESNLFQAQAGLIGVEIDRAMAALTLERTAGSLDASRFDR